MTRDACASLLAVVFTLSGLGCGDDDASVPERRDASSEASTADAATFDAAARDATQRDARASEDAARADAADADAELTGDDASEPAGPPDAAGEDASVTYSDAGPPSAAFTLSDDTGINPLWIRADTQAQASQGAIVETLYDWGDGAGLSAASSHRYLSAGAFTVRQQVRQTGGAVATAERAVTVSEFVPVRFSSSDHSASVTVSQDGYVVENGGGLSGVRTDGAIAPGSGVFYFEGKRLGPIRVGSFGVITADGPLTQPAGYGPLSLGYEAWGPVRNMGGACTGLGSIDKEQTELGFVIDYRGSTPIVDIVQGSGAPSVRATCTMSVTTPLYAFYWSERARVGPEARINTGSDTVNNPFRFDPASVRAALTAAGRADAASALVQGFGKTNAGRLDAPPSIDVPAALSAPLGQSVTITGSAADSEDGALSAQLSWVDRALQYHLQIPSTGPSFTFTPNSLGRHPVEVSVRDLDGVKTTKVVMVTVTGDLPMPNPVQLVPDALTSPGITLSPDALSAHFAGEGKDGIRANSPIYGAFWYFEVHRNNPIRNMGHGLVVGDGDLNPYHFDIVPWSCSLNVWQGIWKNLLGEPVQFQGVESDTDYGWAVDYRGEHPVAYVLVRGKLFATIQLDDVWVPLYPMVYGNIADPAVPGMDMTTNFGATPFVIDARTILSNAGIDVSQLKLGWGVHAQ